MSGRHKDKHGLTPRQGMAVAHYVLHGSMSHAYRRAYSVANMQPATVNRRAIDLFARPQVAARVQAIREEMAHSAHLTREQALGILARIAKGELGRYLDERGHIRPERLQESGPDVEAYSEDRRVSDEDMIVLSRKLKIRNPIQAIERIARMCGWDKQGPSEADGFTIHLNMGERPPTPAKEASDVE